MAAGEDEAQPVVGHTAGVVAVVGGPGFGVVAHQLLEVVEGGLVGRAGLLAPQAIDRASAGDRGQPPTRAGRHALHGPVGRRRGERVGDCVLREREVAAHLPGQRGEERGPLLAIRLLERPVGGDDLSSL
jgi:hypothetical protein